MLFGPQIVCVCDNNIAKLSEVPNWLTFVVISRVCFQPQEFIESDVLFNTASSKNMDGIWNRYNLKSTRRIYTFGVLKCSEKFKVLDLP